MLSRFSNVKFGPPIEVIAVNRAYLDDIYDLKVNLCVTAYRDEEGNPLVASPVRNVERRMAADETLDHEYLPILGLASFSDAAIKLLLGNESNAVLQGRTFGVQTLSGTGALRVGAEFLSQQLKYNTFYYSSPAYGKYHELFLRAGFTEACDYRYWNAETRSLDLDGLLDDLRAAPEDSVVILNSCTHNPTGCLPTRAQWIQIADVMEENQLFPFFDEASQGLASGDTALDAWAVRYFADREFELFCAQSFSENFGLYNERTGNLTVVMKDADVLLPIKSQFTLIARKMYYSPPNHGSRIVATILNNPRLFDEWNESVRTMANRIIDMRRGLKERLECLGTPGTWEHIVTQVGMFSYTGLTPRQVVHLTKKYHIYLLKSGRINICGLNAGNIDYVAQAIHETVLQFPEIDTCKEESEYTE